MYRNDWYTPSRSRRIPVRRVVHNDRMLTEQNQQQGSEFAANSHNGERHYKEQTAPDTWSMAQSESDNTNFGSQSAEDGVNTNQPNRNGAYSDEVAQSREAIESASTTTPNWQAMVLEMRADMENYRKRQVRLAEEKVAQERNRLLKQFLPVADNLQRALQYDTQSDITLREGVALVLRQMMQTLENEGVSTINTTNTPFDPSLHEAVAITPANAKTGTIIDEVETGYTVNGKLLRPAKVVVAT